MCLKAFAFKYNRCKILSHLLSVFAIFQLEIILFLSVATLSLKDLEAFFPSKHVNSWTMKTAKSIWRCYS